MSEKKSESVVRDIKRRTRRKYSVESKLHHGPIITAEDSVMKSIARKSFLSKSGKGLASTAMSGLAWSTLGQTRVLGSNERIGIALIGCGDRGKLVTRHFILPPFHSHQAIKSPS